jgi:hypothetical protein
MIVESLVDGLINKRMSIDQTASLALGECQGGYHQQFFKSLMMELKEANGMPC